MSQVNFESCARRCFEFQTNSDYQQLLTFVQEIRDNIEVIHTGEYGHFLQYLFPVFYNILRNLNVAILDSQSTEHKIRNTILEILNKLPNNELLKPHVQNLLQLCMYLLEVDNEDNAIICLRIIMELHKNYRPNLESEVQPFLNIVQKIYTDLPGTVDRVFRQPPATTATATTAPVGGSSTPTIVSPTATAQQSTTPPITTTSTTSTTTPAAAVPGAAAAAAAAAAASAATPTTPLMTLSMQSFKVLSECPIIVVLLFQLYPSCVNANFIPRKQDLEGKARSIVYKIFDSLINKFVSLKKQIPRILTAAATDANKKDDDGQQQQQPSAADQQMGQTTTDPVKECRGLIRVIIVGVRNIVWALGACPPFRQIPLGGGQTQTIRLAIPAVDESLMHIKMFKNVIKCLPIYGGATPSMSEEKEIVDHFTTSLTMLDYRSFQELFISVMPFLYERSADDQTLLLISQGLLNHQTPQTPPVNYCNPTKTYSEIFAPFLNEKLLNLTPQDKPDLNLIRMLKLLFGSVHSIEVESAVQPILSSIIMTTIKLAVESKQQDATHYFHLLRVIFRSCTKPEFTKDITILFPGILETLNDLLQSSYPLDMMQLFVELALTIPVRITSSMPCIHLLVRPLILALQSTSTDLLTTAFKTLEFFVDHVSGDYLLGVFKENKTEFLQTIWAHLRPTPYFFGPHAVRVLGKMAGKSRSITVLSSTPLTPDPSTNADIVRFLLPYDSSGQQSTSSTQTLSVPFDKVIDTSRTILSTSTDSALQLNTFNVLKSIMSVYLSTDKSSATLSDKSIIQTSVEESLLRFQKSGQVIHFNRIESTESTSTSSTTAISLSPSGSPLQLNVGALHLSSQQPFKTLEEYNEEVRLFKNLLTSFFISTTIETLKNESKEYLGKLIFHFLLIIGVKGLDYQVTPSFELDPKLFLDSLVDFVCLKPNETKSPITTEDCHQILDIAIKSSYQIYSTINPKDEMNPIVKYLFESFINRCYQYQYGNKNGGCIGLQYFVNNSTEYKWICNHETTILKALLFVADDVSYMQFQPLIDSSSEAILALLKCCTPVLDIPQPPTTTTESTTAMDIEKPTVKTEETGEQSQSSTTTTSVSSPTTSEAPSTGSENPVPTAAAAVVVPPPTTTTPVVPPPVATPASTIVVVPSIALPPPPGPLKPSARPSQIIDDKQRGIFKEVVETLFRFLFSAQTHTRKIVQKAISLVSEQSHIAIHYLLDDVRQFFMQVIPKSLKTLSFQAQTGVLEALTFCLSQPMSMIPFTSDAIRVLDDCCVASSEEPSHQIKANSQKSMAIITALRLAGVEMSATAMSCHEFIQSDPTDLINRMVKIFFKAITTRNKEIAVVAKRGLYLAIANQKLVKDLLQPCLRPVLANVTDPKSLSVPFLQGLSRLLELLSNCFNQALGEKLSEYLKRFEESGKLSQQTNRVRENEVVKISAAIIDTFHLLPTAPQLLEATVQTTLKFEQLLGKEVNSPYRTPLIRFLAKYPTRAVEIFLSQPAQWTNVYASTFRLILKNPLAKPIIEELANKYDRIGWVDAMTRTPELNFQGLSILSTVVRSLPEWLPTVRVGVIDKLIELWTNPTRIAQIQAVCGIQPQQQQATTPIPTTPTTTSVSTPVQNAQQITTTPPTGGAITPAGTVAEQPSLPSPTNIVSVNTPMNIPSPSPTILKETKIIVKCFLAYCRAHPGETELLFHLLTVFTIRSSMDFSFVKDFYTLEVAEKTTVEQKRNILVAFLDFFRNTQNTELKVQAIQNIIVPILSTYFKLDAKLKTIEASVFVDIAKNMLIEAEKPIDEQLQIELLQLETFLVKNIPLELMDLRKEIIRFAWNHFKNEDYTCRQSAYVLACRFIEAYDTPQKIVLQVYVQLLKAFQAEAKGLVKQALDILVPVLRTRLPTPTGDARNATWSKWTKKIIVEEGHSLSQLVHILQLIVRHPTMFYPSRSQFIPHMVNMLPKLGLGMAGENKKLALDIIELILTWEKWRSNNINAQQHSNSSSSTAVIVAGSPASVTAATTTTQTASTPLVAMDVATPGQIATPVNEPTPTTPAIQNTSTSTATATSGTTPTGATGDDEYRPPSNVIEHILLFLIRLTTMVDAKNNAIVEKCSDLLKQALVAWPEVVIKYSAFEKPLNSDQPPILTTTVQILNIVLETQASTFIPANLANLQTGLVPSLNLDNPRVAQLLCQTFKHVMAIFPPNNKDAWPAGTNANNEVTTFYQTISQTVGQILDNFEKNFNFSILSIVQLFKDENLDWVDGYLPAIIKMVHKLNGNLLAPNEQPIPPAGGAKPAATTPVVQAQPTPAGAKQAPQQQQQIPKRPDKEVSQALIKCFHLIKSRVSKLSADSRKLYISALYLLCDKTDIELLTEVLSIVSQLIVSKDLPKEKVSFIQKMAKFVQLDNKELTTQYFGLIHQVYSDSSLVLKSELSQLEGSFMLGLRTSDSTTRRTLFDILHKSISTQPYQRLNYILGIQQWDSIGNSYWIRHALELLLAILPMNRPIGFSNNVAKLSLFRSKDETNNNNNNNESSSMQVDSVGGTMDAFSIKLKQHEEFMKESTLKWNTFGEMFGGLREILFTEQPLCHGIWVSTFSAIWARLPKEEHYKLTKTMTTLLTKDYKKIAINSAGAQQQLLTQTTNQNTPPTTTESNIIVKSLLDGVAKCTPPLKIPVELVSYLGDTYNCYYTSIRILESSLLEGTKAPEQTDVVWDCLGGLYQSLNERDVQFGLLRKRFNSDETKLGLLLEQFYMWQSAQEVFLAAMNKYSSNGAKATTKQENLLWEDHWIECAKRLNQWDVLGEYARSQGMYDLLAMSAWKLSAWPLMKEALNKLTVHGDTSALRKILQGYTLILDKKYLEVDPNIVTSNQLILRKWVSLPLRSAKAHAQGLIEMQQVVELQEAVHLLKEVSLSTQHAQALQIQQQQPQQQQQQQQIQNTRNLLMNTLNDVRTIFTIWRERLPTKDEDAAVWNELLTWRQQVFQMIGQGVEHISEVVNQQLGLTGAAVPPAKPIVQPETAWTMNKYAHIARKHNIVEVCLNSLSKMFNLQIEVQDIFLNLKEQIKCYLQLPTHYETGISIINGTNLDYFMPLQKSEFFQLKGEFQSRLRLNADANVNFSTAISLYDNCAKSWMSWGYYCDNQFATETDTQTKANWAESAVNCYIQAIRCDPKYSAKLLPRVLWILYLNNSGEVPQQLPQQPPPPPAQQAPTQNADGATTTPPPPAPVEPKKPTPAQMVLSTIEKTWSILPHWIWFNFLPILITGCYMSAKFPGYGFLCWQLFSKICYLCPNATYYHFRKLVSDMKNNQNSPHFVPINPPPTAGSSSSTTSTISLGPLKMAETLSMGLQPYHSQLISEIDAMLNGLICIANTVPAIHHLGSNLQHILTESFRVSGSALDEIPQEIKDMLTTVHQHYFLSADRYPNHAILVDTLKTPFENDFGVVIGVKMDSGETTLMSLIGKLIEWVQRRFDPELYTVKGQVFMANRAVQLEKIVPQLEEFRPSMVDLPTHLSTIAKDPSHYAHNVRIDKIGSIVTMVKNSIGMLCPRITLHANNGKEYSYLIDITPQLFSSKTGARDFERRNHLLSSVNTILLKHRETRRRAINLNHYPTTISITPSLTLIQSLGSREYNSLLDVWSTMQPETELYTPLVMFRNKLLGQQQSVATSPTNTSTTSTTSNSGESTTSTPPKSHHKQPTKLQSFREISKFMTDGLLSSFINRTLLNYQEQYEFKFNFAVQWGLHSMLSYVLFSRVASLSPSDIFFSRSSGSVYFGKWAPLDFANDASMEFSENGVVPFRLTQNIRSYLNPVFIEGSYQSSLLSTSICFSEMKDQLVNLLYIFSFDEMCWNIVEPTNKSQHIHREIVERTTKIVDKMVSTRINSITPPIQPDKTLFLTPIIKRVGELIQLSSNSSNISQMESISYPWL
ncbi:protein kinase [Cavenderia fasciculata]|uniref:Protein kinase n=1 Tax=Cavenderia fasciculata TaxID=261658 RepID=F4PK69_CACFS|nr:protein kinase [Cavenderia fasciculata]EGG23993.1 protein kinase [Cavenderia fasciculata]|eukprot:XP_004361844.1 protein kinase [Cavenderia fasciculata]